MTKKVWVDAKLWVQIKVQDSRMQLLSKELEMHFRVWL